MLLGTLGASILGNLLSGKGIVRAGFEMKWIFNTALSLYSLKYKSIMRMNQHLMEFFQEIICLKNKGWGIRNKP